MKNPIIIFIMFIILVIVAILIYDSNLTVSFDEKKHLGLVGNNTSAPIILHSLPQPFINLLIPIIGIVIVFAVMIGLFNYFRR